MKNNHWLKSVAAVVAGVVLSGYSTSARAADAVPNPLRVYFIGNSVTDTIGYKALAEMAEARRHKMIWGRQMIPGAPLPWILNNIDKGITEPPFGHPTQAFSDFEWDAVSLQPFDRRLHDTSGGKPDGDVEVCQIFIDMALKKSPNAQIYIYSRWPRITKQGKGFNFDKDAFNATSGKVDLAKLGDIDDYTDRWTSKWKGGYDLTNETRDYFERLLNEIRKNKPEMKKPVLLVPVGDVMNELHKKMKAGEIPGYKSIYEVYADSIHLNNVGRFIVGTTFYATLFKEDPTGINPAPFKVTDAALAKTIQQTAWKVVSENPDAGIAKGK